VPRRSASQVEAVAPHLNPYVPASRDLEVLRAKAAVCQGCDLYKNATQTVFGEGPATARVILVGEQPGDREDLAGRPFVGPAGRLLDDVLELAGVPRDETYVTNAVKHFKFEPRGKRRMHQRPNAQEIRVCKEWLFAEMESLKPEVIVCLGATAAQAFMGSSFRITQHRGEVMTSTWARVWMATHHPAAVLRMPDEAARHAAKQELLSDLRRVSEHLGNKRR
jgi:uracil-DNA glycosylase